ncbi:aldolase/citrate lyase family protein [Clostridiaceae bacterium HFYG-1003]|nr:aldolase/citrate lyase family protein [Clostridiaceae bacterium HFYG-1003]
MQNELKRALEAGHTTYGTFLEIGHMNSVEAMEGTGLDYVILDAEHSAMGAETILDLIRASEIARLTPLVRIAQISHREIQRILDSGAQGLVVPGIKTLEELRLLVDFAKFPPIGERSFCPTRVSRWGAQEWAKGTLDEYMSHCNQEVLVLPQCETRELLEVIEDASALAGIDGFFIGPYDLSISMGIPGQFDHPDFKAALRRICQAVLANGKLLMVFTGDPANVKAMTDLGIRGITLGMDTAVLHQGYCGLVRTARQK